MMANQEKIFLTKEGKARIEQELKELLRLRTHKSGGESPQIFHSEDINPEFLTFQEDFELMETRIAELETILRTVQLITQPPKEERGIVSLGAIVIVEVGGQEDEFQIVGSMEANPAMGKISNECPVGKAILGHHIGDEVVIGPSSKVAYKIKKIKYEILR